MNETVRRFSLLAGWLAGLALCLAVVFFVMAGRAERDARIADYANALANDAGSPAFMDESDSSGALRIGGWAAVGSSVILAGLAWAARQPADQPDESTRHTRDVTP